MPRTGELRSTIMCSLERRDFQLDTDGCSEAKGRRHYFRVSVSFMSVEPQLTTLGQGNGSDDGVRQDHTLLVPDAAIDERSSLPSASPMISSHAPDELLHDVPSMRLVSLWFPKRNCTMFLMSSEAKTGGSQFPRTASSPL